LGKGFKEMIDLIGFHGIERALTIEALKLFEQVKVACCGSLFVV
jgi:hypothetical protein